MIIFDCLKEIICTKTGTAHTDPSFMSAWDNYMIVRYLSMDGEYFDIAQEMNKLSGTMSKEMMYKYLVKKLPRRKSSFIGYLKKEEKKKSKKKVDDLVEITISDGRVITV